jgi:TraB/PrgY/gumN family
MFIFFNFPTVALSLILVGAVLPIQVQAKVPTAKTLLWEISGNELTQPSYLFGTIHSACASQLLLTPEQRKAMSRVQQLYLEILFTNERKKTVKSSEKNGRQQKLKDVMTTMQYQIVEDFFEKSYLDSIDENASVESVIFKLIRESEKRIDVYYHKNLCKKTTSKENILIEFAKKHINWWYRNSNR